MHCSILYAEWTQDWRRVVPHAQALHTARENVTALLLQWRRRQLHAWRTSLDRLRAHDDADTVLRARALFECALTVRTLHGHNAQASREESTLLAAATVHMLQVLQACTST